MNRGLVLLVILIISVTIATYIVLVTIPSRLAERSYEGVKAMAEDVRNAFQLTPEVKVHNTIVLNQQSSVLELSVLSQDFEHRYTWQNSWLGSTKRILITGRFKAKVGFDLRKKFSITLQGDKAYVSLPRPETLSVESFGDMSYRDEQGIWNWVDPQDRTRATNAFISDARRYANRAGFVHDAERRMREQLQELLSPYADEVIVDFRRRDDLLRR